MHSLPFNVNVVLLNSLLEDSIAAHNMNVVLLNSHVNVALLNGLLGLTTLQLTTLGRARLDSTSCS